MATAPELYAATAAWAAAVITNSSPFSVKYRVVTPLQGPVTSTQPITLLPNAFQYQNVTYTLAPGSGGRPFVMNVASPGGSYNSFQWGYSPYQFPTSTVPTAFYFATGTIVLYSISEDTYLIYNPQPWPSTPTEVPIITPANAEVYTVMTGIPYEYPVSAISANYVAANGTIATTSTYSMNNLGQLVYNGQVYSVTRSPLFPGTGIAITNVTGPQAYSSLVLGGEPHFGGHTFFADGTVVFFDGNAGPLGAYRIYQPPTSLSSSGPFPLGSGRTFRLQLPRR